MEELLNSCVIVVHTSGIDEEAKSPSTREIGREKVGYRMGGRESRGLPGLTTHVCGDDVTTDVRGEFKT